jgi:hypothetical protein
VEGDDGVDQGEALLAQARLAGRDALARGPAGGRREFAGGGGFRESAGVQYQ